MRSNPLSSVLLTYAEVSLRNGGLLTRELSGEQGPKGFKKTRIEREKENRTVDFGLGWC